MNYLFCLGLLLGLKEHFDVLSHHFHADQFVEVLLDVLRCDVIPPICQRLVNDFSLLFVEAQIFLK